MTTPFDGKLNWWHWHAEDLDTTISTPTELAQAVRTRTPGASGVVVKVVHGHTWEGARGAEVIDMRDLADLIVWARAMHSLGLELHIWAVPVGADPQREAAAVALASHVPGVKSVILDVEPYDGFWQGDVAAATQYIDTLRANVGDDMHVGISVDSRTPDKLRAIHFYEWMEGGTDSVHPQVYWHDFGLPFGIALHECTETLAGYGLPIYPVLGTYPNPRTGVAVPPAQLTAALVATKQAMGAASLFRLGGDNWTDDICDAVNKGWGNA